MTDEVSRVEDRLEIDEMVTRGFMVIGVVIWTTAAVLAAIAGTLSVAYAYTLIALFVAGVLVVGWYYERIAAIAMGLAAGALVAWGIAAGWEIGIWFLMVMTLIAPIAVGTAMYYFAEHEEEVIEHATNALPVRGVHA